MPGKTSEALVSGESWPWWATLWLLALTLWLGWLTSQRPVVPDDEELLRRVIFATQRRVEVRP